VDGIAQEAIANNATPGAVVLVVKNGKIVFEKSYGYYDYAKQNPVTTNSIFDMASVTKICATTIAIMKLYDEGKIKLIDTLGKFIPWVRGTNKGSATIQNILLHQARLKAWIPFYKEVIDTMGLPNPLIFSKNKTKEFAIPVADSLYMLTAWRDTMYKRMVQSKLEDPNKYIYSDNDFIFLGLIVEQLSGKTLDAYVTEFFYKPLGLQSTGFLPLQKFDHQKIVPTENEKYFRLQTLKGYVHDPGAAMFGGIAGHAGLFSCANDLAIIMQMLLNGGEMDGRRYLKKETIDLFTAYQSEISRRGYGFDKPEKDNETRKEAYPSKFVSTQTFGHTGFTGTCVWADPKENLIYIFLSNRVHPLGGDNQKLLKMNIRSRIHDAIYEAMKN
jgi:CubicO group peptidase (beta-lactamase class C family)